jgi:CRISPR-associated protein Csm1
MYKQFFAGEIELLCSLPEFWRKVSIIFTGGDDFALYGSWDALIPLAREIQRLFHRFSEENLKDFPGPEGKTLTMAIALAPEIDASLASVYEDAGHRLELAKSADKDCVHVFGRTLEWRQLAAASDLRETITRMAEELDSPQQFLAELAALYRKASVVADESTGGETRFRKPWRVYRRLNLAVGEPKAREIQKLRNQLTNEMLAKSFAQVKLRPGGRVALDWARLLTEV